MDCPFKSGDWVRVVSLFPCDEEYVALNCCYRVADIDSSTGVYLEVSEDTEWWMSPSCLEYVCSDEEYTSNIHTLVHKSLPSPKQEKIVSSSDSFPWQKGCSLWVECSDGEKYWVEDFNEDCVSIPENTASCVTTVDDFIEGMMKHDGTY